MSEQHRKFLRKLQKRKISVVLLQIGFLLVFFVLWELLTRFEVLDPFIFSSPSAVARIIYKLYRQNNLLSHVFSTVIETVLGFLISTIVGTLIAIILWWNSLIKDVAQPYLVTLNSLPKIALGPIIIIWVGAGKAAIITMAVLISIIITIISMMTGFTTVDKEKTMLLNSLHATKMQTLLKLVLPSNIPTFISVLKINVGLSWVGTIMGEYLVSREGIGYLIVYGSQVFQLDLVMASTVILCIMAAGMYGAVAFLEKAIAKRF